MADLNYGRMIGVVLAAVFASARPVAAASSEFVQVTAMVADQLASHHVPSRSIDSAQRRPALLVPLYVSLATLQAADARSTYLAIREGLVELNPIMVGAAHSPGRITAVKLATTTCTIAASELLWRSHRRAAVVTMIVLNVTVGAVAANNVRQLR